MDAWESTLFACRSTLDAKKVAVDGWEASGFAQRLWKPVESPPKSVRELQKAVRASRSASLGRRFKLAPPGLPYGFLAGIAGMPG